MLNKNDSEISETVFMGPMNLIERWLPVVGYESFYEVSDWGRVKSLERTVAHKGSLRNLPERILKCTISYLSRKPYLIVCLYRDGVQTTNKFHLLVLTAFVGERPPRMHCRHLNDDGCDARLANLQWGTPKQNVAGKVGKQHRNLKLEK
jgi:hypothetical protein